MTKNPRRRVVRWEERLLQPPFDSWGPTMHAVLECGHVHNVGHSSLRPKHKACPDCGSRGAGVVTVRPDGTNDPVYEPCKHLWTMFCQGSWEEERSPYWRVDICVRCYAKREVPV